MAHFLPRASQPTLVLALVLALCLLGAPYTRGALDPRHQLFLPLVAQPGALAAPAAIVFVSRQIPSNGSIYAPSLKDAPGVGPHSRFRPAAPGQLVLRATSGALRVLVDGGKPGAASLNLIDVSAPAVSYDGNTIAFAGLPSGNYDAAPARNLGAWRIYRVNADGSGLKQITFSDQRLDLTQFGAAASSLSDYDDIDPAWLPDGRIVFSSTRWPSYGHYSGARASNLYVVGADGSALHRITAERNGADRPLVDPITGKIVYARWWRNQRFPINDKATIADVEGFKQKDGVTSDRNNPVGGASMFRNAWQATTINPDGTGLALWAGSFRDEAANHIYGGAFAPSGELFANFFPMYNMTEAAGFGGIRKYTRGPGIYKPIIGVTNISKNYLIKDNSATPQDENSYGIYAGPYAVDPDVLPDGRLVISLANDANQDYGLFIINADGSGLSKLYDRTGTSELQARVVRSRPVPPIIADSITKVASLLPPTADPATFRKDGTFTFTDLNVYANAPVDSDIVSAPAVGSAATIRFFMDQQRTSPGSFPALDWPILLGELAISPDGALSDANAPANVPLFEQVRSPDGTVPLTYGPLGDDGAAHVAGMNFGRPGAVVRCVGCHAGHSLMPVPANAADAKWTNIAPGATLTVSSARDPKYTTGLTDRRVLKGENWRYWTSDPQQAANGQWAQLSFAVPATVRTVRLYNPRTGGEASSSLQVDQATVILYADAAATQEVGRKSANALLVSGTDITFPEVKVRAVRVVVDAIHGTFYGAKLASLAEIEVIARAEAAQ